MFKNPGGSLKNYGKVVFIIFVIAAIAGGIAVFVGAGSLGRYNGGAAFGMVIVGIVVIAVGIFMAYLLSIFVIAFGELVENSTVIRRMMENGAVMPDMQQSEYKPYVPQKNINLEKNIDAVAICPFCGKDNKADASFCRQCGKKLN